MANDDDGAKSGAGPGCPALEKVSEERKPGVESSTASLALGDVGALAHQEVTAEELAAIKQFVTEPQAARRGGGRFAIARVAGMFLLVVNVGVGLGDGNEFDEVGCTVAVRPAGTCQRARSGQVRNDDGGKVPGGGCGSGACGGGGSGGRPECEARAERCVYRRADGMCRRNGERCRLLEPRNAERRYVLEKGLGGWRLVFEGRNSVLPDEKGVAYVAALLRDPPAEPIHGAELANRAFGDAIVDGQRNLAMDDEETMRAMREARRRCQAVIDGAPAGEVERREAQAELEEIVAWARRHLRGTEGAEQRQVRAIRQAIRRLLESLRVSGDPVLRAFGEHVEHFLWQPSGRAGQGRAWRVRAGLAGRFTYEPPDGVTWLG